jgi:hypothetical protein
MGHTSHELGVICKRPTSLLCSTKDGKEVEDKTLKLDETIGRKMMMGCLDPVFIMTGCLNPV